MPSKNNIPRILNKPKTPIIKNLNNKKRSLNENALFNHNILQPNFHEIEFQQKKGKTVIPNIRLETKENDPETKLKKTKRIQKSTKEKEKENFIQEFTTMAKQLKIKKIPDITSFYDNLIQISENDFLKDFKNHFQTTMEKLYKINTKNNKKDLITDLISILEKEILDFKIILKSDILNNVKIINKDEHLNKINTLEKQIKFDRDYNITWKMLKTSLYLRSSLIKLYININNK